MADQKITALTNYTTPLDADVLPIVDVANGITKKIPINAIFPASSTDNAIARFDGVTGKLLQNSGIILEDIDSNLNYILHPLAVAGVGTGVVLRGSQGGNNFTGGGVIVIGYDGAGSGDGGTARVIGGAGGTTGVGGAVTIEGGNGGSVSGSGNTVSIIGGAAVSGNGGNINIFPGATAGGGGIGHINLYSYHGFAFGATLDLSGITASDKTFTFPNLTGTFVVASAVNVVSPTSPNRTLTIDIGGTTYYIAAKTTNN